MRDKATRFLTWLGTIAALIVGLALTTRYFALVPYAVANGSLEVGFEHRVLRYDQRIAPRTWLEIGGIHAGTGLIGGMESGGQFLCWFVFLQISYGWLTGIIATLVGSAIVWRLLRRSRASPSALR